jgi:hypothetical protein
MEPHETYAVVDQLTRELERAEQTIQAIKAAAHADRHTARAGVFRANLRKALHERRELERQLLALSSPLFYRL